MKVLNKKAILILIISVTAIALSYYFFQTQEKKLEIFYIHKNELLVKEVGGNPEEWQASYTIREGTVLCDKKGRHVSLQDLNIGHVIIVRSTEQAFVLTSNPPKLVAKEIIVVR